MQWPDYALRLQKVSRSSNAVQDPRRCPCSKRQKTFQARALPCSKRQMPCSKRQKMRSKSQSACSKSQVLLGSLGSSGA